MDDEAPGVPEWVVTYGDMMSQMRTLGSFRDKDDKNEESGRRQKPVRRREARSDLSHTRRNGVEGRRTGDFRSQ